MTKTNKGFSLVELLVAMAVLAIVMAELAQVIFSSSKLYLYGTYEVDLQTEAQQIIQQIEDMIVDARVDVSANYVASLSSDQVITISTNSLSSNSAIEYKINFVPNTDPTKEYGSLTLTVRDSAGTVGPIPMAEYVKSVSLDFAEYETDNMLTLYITMQNDRYSYTTTKDIFLRNMLGTGARKRGNQNDSDKLIGVEVLRFGTYDLDTICAGYIDEYVAEHGVPDSIYYAWDDYTLSHLPSEAAGDPDSIYDLSSGGDLKCGPTLLTGFDYEEGGLGSNIFKVVCYAMNGSRKSEVCQIQLYTVKVSTGLGRGFTNSKAPYGYGLVYGQKAYSEDVVCCIPVNGIDMTALKDVSLESCVAHNGMTSVTITSASGTLPLTLGSNDIWNAEVFSGVQGNSIFPSYGLDNPNGNFNWGKMQLDGSQNSIRFDVNRSMSGNADKYQAYTEAGFRFRTDAVINFEQGTETAELKLCFYYFILAETITDDSLDTLFSQASHD